MPPRPLARLVAPVALAALASLGAPCPFVSPILDVQPADSAVVGAFAVPIRVELSTASTVERSTLRLRINGNQYPLSGGPHVYSAVVGPGAPLRDDNVLEVSVRQSGVVHTTTTSFRYAPPGKASARRITLASERIRGPLGHSRVGDWLLENGVARFAVQDAPQRDLHSVGQFGGNLIDAELVGRPGRDSFFEFQPSINIESVLNAQSVEIVNDGQDGRAAVVRSCGPDDLLDYVNPSSQVAEFGVELPPSIDDVNADVEACTEYRLAPNARHVEVVTTLYNLTDQTQGFYVGDYLNGMGTLEQWTPPGPGVGELLVFSAGAQIYFGFEDAAGVDYALIPIPVEGVDRGSSSFTTSGVTFMLQSHSIAVVLALGANATPTFFVPPQGQKSFERRFAVGDGSPSNSVDLLHQIEGEQTGRLRGCVRVGGEPAPGARVAVGPVGGAGQIASLATLFVTDALGCYDGRLEPGSYGASAARLGAPFEDGAASPPVRPVQIAAGQVAVRDFELPAGARLHVTVADGAGQPVPARVSVVGVDASPEPQLFGSILGNTLRMGLFRDVSKDPLPWGLVTMAYTDPPGVAELDVEPGSYRVYVSRGAEWSLYAADVTLDPGETELVDARIARVLDTAGFVSSDYHVHLVDSPDSRISAVSRVLSYAGEGVDNLIATDHDALTDLAPTIRALGLRSFLHSTVGEEITSFDYGHFNAYPQRTDAARPSRGSTDWGRAAPVGEDFPSLGHYVRTPAEIEAEAIGKPQNAGLETTVQINHISSHFGPLRIDTSATPPQSFLPDPSVFRLDPSVANFFHPFAALELWNGANRGAQNVFLQERMGIWMNLLNQGFPTTAISDTDTHTFYDLETAGAHTWTPSSSDAPPSIVDDEIGLAVKGGRAVGGQGLYVQTRLEADDEASFALGGSTLAHTSGASATLHIDVQAPLWAAYDTIEIYANAETTVAGTNGGTPVYFGANPTRVLTQAGGDFAVATELVDAGVPGASRQRTQLEVDFDGLTEDTWFAVIVKGTVGQSPPMFPVYARDLSSAQNPGLAELVVQTPSEQGVRALGVTNALYLDVDGNGVFDAPGVRVAP